MYVHEGNGRNEFSSKGLVNYHVLFNHDQETYSASFSNWNDGALWCTFDHCNRGMFDYTENENDMTEEVTWALNREAAINFAEQVVDAIKMMDEKYGRENW